MLQTEAYLYNRKLRSQTFVVQATAVVIVVAILLVVIVVVDAHMERPPRATNLYLSSVMAEPSSRLFVTGFFY
jgi:hypothetical protein